MLQRDNSSRVSGGGTHISFADVVGVFVDVPGQAKVADFDHVVVREQNVSGRQIAVDALGAQTTRENTHRSNILMHCVCVCVCIEGQTFREARNSIPRATWKLKEMRFSRNKGELVSDLVSVKEREEPCACQAV